MIAAASSGCTRSTRLSTLTIAHLASTADWPMVGTTSPHRRLWAGDEGRDRRRTVFSRSASALPPHAPGAHGPSGVTHGCLALGADSASHFTGSALPWPENRPSLGESLLGVCPTCGGTPISGPHTWGSRVRGPALGYGDPWPARPCPGVLSPLKTAIWQPSWGCVWGGEDRWHSLCFL